MIMTARPQACLVASAQLFLSSIKAPVPPSRPAIVPASARGPCPIRRLRREWSRAQPPLGGEHGKEPRLSLARSLSELAILRKNGSLAAT